MNTENEIKNSIIDILLNEFETEVKSEKWEDIIFSSKFRNFCDQINGDFSEKVNTINSIFKEVFNVDLTSIKEINLDVKDFFNFWLFRDNRCKLEKIIMDDNIEIIPEYACAFLNIKTVKLPSNLKLIDVNAFRECKYLYSLTLPDEVEIISPSAFTNCNSLTNIKIPNSVTWIGSYAFYNCSSLENVTISNNVTNIGGHAFHNCSSLESIIIPNSVTSIGIGAFLNCSLLTSITIPNSVISIGEYAFNGCSSLTNITIPKRFKNEMWKIFNGVDLTKIKINYI